MSLRKKHKHNPFPFKLIERIDVEDGRVRHKDRLPFCRVSSDIVSDVFANENVGVCGLRVLGAIMRVLLRNKEHFFLNYTMYESVMGKGVSNKNGYYNGINELLEADVIACSEHSNMYWVNTNYLFKGDRTKMLRDKKWCNGMFNT